MLIGLPGGLEGGNVVVVVEEGCLAGGLEGGPVAADDAVVGDDGLEDAAVVVGAVGVLGRENNVAALVADEVFVVGRDQEVFALAETMRAAVICQVEFPTLPFHGMNPVAQHGDAFAAVADVQARPPDEILERGGLMALEILAGKAHQGFFSVYLARRFHFVGGECVGRFHGQEVAAAQRSRYFGHADVIGQPMVIHADIPLGQRLDEVLFGHAALVGSRLGKDVPNAHQFLVGYADLIAAHPSLGDSDGLRSAQANPTPIVLGRDQLPSAAHQVQTDDPSAVEGLFESPGRRLAGAHLHGPAHHAVFLCLHGAHVADHLGRVAELRRDKLLVEKSDGDGVHA